MNKHESKYFNTAILMDEALINLLNKKNIEYISIKEICDAAGVNRSTFYLHYESINDLVNEIEKLIWNLNENISILIKDLSSENEIYNLNSTEKLVSASTIKVPIMLAIFEEVKSGKVNLNDTILVTKNDILDDTEIFENGENYYSINELINWMIIESDNTATNVLLKYFGMENINNYIINVLNIKNTYVQRYMLDEKAIKNGLNNYMSQKDMLDIFTLLFSKKILNNELCEKAINILYNQRCQNQIMRYIFEPVKYAHKTGSLDYLSHDVGVMNIKDKLFYIGISIWNSSDKDGDKKLIGNIGKIIYYYLNQ